MIKTLKKGRKFENLEAVQKIGQLELGQEMVITKDEWSATTIPGAFYLRRRLKREFTVNTLEDNTGWLIRALS